LVGLPYASIWIAFMAAFSTDFHICLGRDEQTTARPYGQVAIHDHRQLREAPVNKRRFVGKASHDGISMNYCWAGSLFERAGGAPLVLLSTTLAKRSDPQPHASKAGTAPC
jgi:hypothetical protein